MTSSIRMEDNQIQILGQCQNFFVVFIANEHLDFFKSDVSFFGLEGFQLEFMSDEPIGYVDVVLHVFGCGVGLKKVAHADVETGEVLCLQQLIFRCSVKIALIINELQSTGRNRVDNCAILSQ